MKKGQKCGTGNLPKCEGTGNAWTLEQAKGGTVALLFQVLPPDL